MRDYKGECHMYINDGDTAMNCVYSMDRPYCHPDQRSQYQKDKDNFEEWLRSVCFKQPTKEAYDLAKAAWHAAIKNIK
jgi:hypothetical protein